MSRRQKDQFESFSLTEFLGRPFRAMGRIVTHLGGKDDFKDSGGNSVSSFLFFPVQLFFGCLSFLIHAWSTSRNVAPFLIGIPAIMVFTGVPGAAWLDYFRMPNKVARTMGYYEKFRMDPKTGPAIATHFAAKSVQLQPDNLDAKINLATSWDAIGDGYRAEDLMQYLVEKGHPLAHVWFARKLMENERAGFSNSNPETRKKVEAHLEASIAIDETNNRARITLADYCMMQAESKSISDAEKNHLLEKASEQLMVVADSGTGEIVFHLPKLVKLLVDRDDQAKAKQVYSNTRKALLNFVKRQPGNEMVPQVWVALVQSAFSLKDFTDAKGLIEEGRLLHNDSRMSMIFKQLATQLDIERASVHRDFSSQEAFDQYFNLLGKASAESPFDGQVSRKLVELIRKQNAEEERPEEFDGIGMLENHVGNSGLTHLLLGTNKVIDSNVEQGRFHWKIARSQLASSELILFSILREIVADKSMSDLSKRDLIALAIELFPKQGYFYFLRGGLAVASSDIKQGLPDFLEAARIIGEPNNFEIHVQLVKSYKELGDNQNADLHRRQLQRIIEKSERGQRIILENYLDQVDR